MGIMSGFFEWSPNAVFWAALSVPVGVLHRVDRRTLDGVSVWSKPLKFTIAIAIFLATLGAVSRYLDPAQLAGTTYRITSVVGLLATDVEVAYIVVQGARGQHSHFNATSLFATLMFRVMGICAVLLTAPAVVLGLLAAGANNPALSPPLRVGIVGGLVGGGLLTLITAISIGARGSPYVGARPTPDRVIPFTRWSRTAGDLRAPHFFALHMMQVGPVLGAALELWPGGVEGALVVTALLVAYAAFVVGIFRAARRAIPLADYLGIGLGLG